MTKYIHVSRTTSEALYQILKLFTRDRLRTYAKDFDIPRGRFKANTILNLVENRHKFKDEMLVITLT